MNRNRQMDAGEPGIAGLPLQLARVITLEGGPAFEEPWRQAISGIDGAYAFADLPMGSYVVTVTVGSLESTTPRRVEVALFDGMAVREVWFGLAQSPPKRFLPWVGVVQSP